MTWILSLKCQPQAFFNRCQLLGLGLLTSFCSQLAHQLKVPHKSPSHRFQLTAAPEGYQWHAAGCATARTRVQNPHQALPSHLVRPSHLGTSAHWASVLTWHKWPRAADAGRRHHSGTLPDCRECHSSSEKCEQGNSHIPSGTGKVSCLPLHTPRAPSALKYHSGCWKGKYPELPSN